MSDLRCANKKHEYTIDEDNVSQVKKKKTMARSSRQPVSMKDLKTSKLDKRLDTHLH